MGLNEQQVEDRLLNVLVELEAQEGASSSYPDGTMPYVEHMAFIRESIELAGEYGIAYESIVASLETIPFSLSGKAVVALLEVALTMGFKTSRPKDTIFKILSSYPH